MKHDTLFKRYGAKRLLRLAAVLDTVDAEHAKKGEPGYCQSIGGHPCGTPACALGHWVKHSRGRLTLKLNPAIGSMHFVYPSTDDYHEAFIAGHEFGLDFTEGSKLFGVRGCGLAKSGKEAAHYIREFVGKKIDELSHAK